MACSSWAGSVDWTGGTGGGSSESPNITTTTTTTNTTLLSSSSSSPSPRQRQQQHHELVGQQQHKQQQQHVGENQHHSDQSGTQPQALQHPRPPPQQQPQQQPQPQQPLQQHHQPQQQKQHPHRPPQQFQRPAFNVRDENNVMFDLRVVHPMWRHIAQIPSASKKSRWWNGFHELPTVPGGEGAAGSGAPGNSEQQVKAVCNLCGITFAAGNGTKPLSNHYKVKHNNIYHQINEKEEEDERSKEAAALAAASAASTSTADHHSMIAQQALKERSKVPNSIRMPSKIPQQPCDEDSAIAVSGGGNNTATLHTTAPQQHRTPFNVTDDNNVEFDLREVHPMWRHVAQVPRSNKKSRWWNGFHELMGDAGELKAVCNLCGATFAAGNGTKPLSNHYKLKHEAIFNQINAKEEDESAKEADAAAAVAAGAAAAVAAAAAAASADRRLKMSSQYETATTHAVEDGRKFRGIGPRISKRQHEVVVDQHNMRRLPSFNVKDDNNVDFDLRVVHPMWKDIAQIPSSSKSSRWWNGYHEVIVEGKLKAVCNLCGITFAAGNGTKPLSNHYKTKHEKIYHQINAKEEEMRTAAAPSSDGTEGNAKGKSQLPQQQFAVAAAAKRPLQRNTPGGVIGGSIMKKKTPKMKKQEEREDAEEEVLDCLALLMAKSNLPLNAVNSEAMKDYANAVAAAGKVGARYMFSPGVVKARVGDLAERARSIIKDRLDGNDVIVTTDHWTSRLERVTRASTTVHWIDEFKCHSAVLLCREHKGAPTRKVKERVTHDFENAVKAWNLVDKKVPYVVCHGDCTLNKAFGVNTEGANTVEKVICFDQMLQLVAFIAYSSILDTGQPDFFDELDENGSFSEVNFQDGLAVKGGDASDHDDGNDDDDDNNGLGGDDDYNDFQPLKKKRKTSKLFILKKARLLVKHFATQSQANERLLDLQTTTRVGKAQHRMVVDVSTRWWSAYRMVERLLDLKATLGVLASEEHEVSGLPKSVALKKEEWKVLEELKELLKPLYKGLLEVAGAKYVTASIIPLVAQTVYDDLRRNTLHGQNASVKEVAQEMMRRMEEVFGDFFVEPTTQEGVDRAGRRRLIGINKAFMYAHALDPRFKTMAFIPDVETRKNFWNEMKKEMYLLFDKDSKNNEEADPSIANPAIVAQSAPASSDDSGRESPLVTNRWASVYDNEAQSEKGNYEMGFQYDDAFNWQQQCNQELLRYQKEKHVRMQPGIRPVDAFDPLTWWKERHLTYPTLWRLAKKYLAIPAISAASERAYCIDGDISSTNSIISSGADDVAIENIQFLHEEENYRVLSETQPSPWPQPPPDDEFVQM